MKTILIVVFALAASFVLVGFGSSSTQKTDTDKQLMALQKKLKSLSLEEFRSLSADSIRVFEYRRVYPDDLKRHDPIFTPPFILVDADSMDTFACSFQKVRSGDQKGMKALHKSLKKMVAQTSDHQFAHGQSLQIGEIDLEPAMGVSGILASNVDWIIKTKNINGKLKITGIVVAMH